jgi:hypothetical protein
MEAVPGIGSVVPLSPDESEELALLGSTAATASAVMTESGQPKT